MVESSQAQDREDRAVVRKVRLKAEFAHLYPPLDPGVWLPAAEASAKILFYRLSTEGPEALARRLLDDPHFEFRGGWTRGGTPPVRTRATDPEDAARL
jgi:hypothetical protein